jgi:LCP family protein required for cell wall assembly
MNFETKKIDKNTPRKKPQFKHKKKLTISITLLVPLVIITVLILGIFKACSQIDFSFFLEMAGDELEADAYGHTNILVLGTGGLNHDGANLTDSIIVASLDYDNNLVSMLSIPRDLYVEDSILNNSRINEVYANGRVQFESSSKGIEYMKEKVEEIVGMPIHYWLKVDFKGFKDLIDALGGIEVYVKEDLNDPYYPKDGTILFEPLYIKKGIHEMDGELALKYARSRKTTSDFDRANRQQDLIYAIKEKALDLKVILSKDKIENILDALKDNIETNIKIKEILTLGSYADNFSEQNILHRLIHDDPTQCGGFLYTPERKFYGGMFVLIPAGNYDFLHNYSNLNFNFPQVARENLTVQILNGTKTGSVAGTTKQILQRYCFNIIRYGNGRNQDITETTYYYRSEKPPAALDFLKKLIPGKESKIIPTEYNEYTADIIIELGTDYVNSEKYIDDPFYYLPEIVLSNINGETTDDEDQ